MINFIVFSKDRACQLELLLRSMKKHFTEWSMIKTSILYTYSTDDFRLGYEKTKQYHPEFSYVQEQPGRFKDQVIELIKPENQATMFFVDDQVFKNRFDLKTDQVRRFLMYSNIVCLSLRMCPRMDYCYTEKRSTPQPRFTPMNEWFWPDQIGDWSYPHSLDAHLFRTDDILPLAKELEYTNPNTFEGALAARPPLHKPFMICYDEAKVMNIPVNKVQTANGNHCGNIPAEYLNKEFLSSKRISLSNIELVKNTAPHQELPIVFEPVAPKGVPGHPTLFPDNCFGSPGGIAGMQGPSTEGVKPTVSVCIPAYEMHGKGVSMLRRAVESVLCQRYKNYELIVSDHSTDDSIETYVRSIPGIKYLRCTEGRGISSVNLNNAIRNATGEYIKPLFQDDFLFDEDSLGTFVEGIGDAVWAAGVSVHHSGDELQRLHSHVPRQTCERDLLYGLNGIGCPSAVIFRNSVNLFDSRLLWLMDTEFYYRMLLKYGQIKIVDQARVGIRIWENSVGKTIATDEVKSRELEYVLNKANSIVTFIVPSIGRDSLNKTIKHLQEQTLNAWQCIVVFDGVRCPAHSPWKDDSRITYIEIEKAGSSANRHGNAGKVRNVALPHVTTPYTAFVDDDDYLDPTYVESILQEIGTDDGIVFRMRMPSGKVVPPLEMGNQIVMTHVGISFVLKTNKIKENNLRFINSNGEDFDFLDKAIKSGMHIHVSEKVLYCVGANE